MLKRFPTQPSVLRAPLTGGGQQTARNNSIGDGLKRWLDEASYYVCQVEIGLSEEICLAKQSHRIPYP